MEDLEQRVQELRINNENNKDDYSVMEQTLKQV